VNSIFYGLGLVLFAVALIAVLFAAFFAAVLAVIFVPLGIRLYWDMWMADQEQKRRELERKAEH